MPNDYHPTSPVYDPTFKQDPLPHYSLKEKLVMDLDWSDKDWDGNRQRVREQKKKADSNLTTTTNNATTTACTDIDCLLDIKTTPICELCKTAGDQCPFEIKPAQPSSHSGSEDWIKEEK